MAKVKQSTQTTTRKRRPAITPEGRENQLVSLAFDLVEQRLLDGTASSQETTHFLKLGTEKARLEREKLKAENELLIAKKEDIQNNKDMKILYADAIKAMRRYSGQGGYDEEDEY